MKFIWKIESGKGVCPLVEAESASSAILEAIRVLGEYGPDFVAFIYRIEKIGALPDEYKKLGTE